MEEEEEEEDEDEEEEDEDEDEEEEVVQDKKPHGERKEWIADRTRDPLSGTPASTFMRRCRDEVSDVAKGTRKKSQRKNLTVLVHRQAAENRYVDWVRLNGVLVSGRTHLRHDELAQGALLEFGMRPDPGSWPEEKDRSKKPERAIGGFFGTRGFLSSSLTEVDVLRSPFLAAELPTVTFPFSSNFSLSSEFALLPAALLLLCAVPLLGLLRLRCCLCQSASRSQCRVISAFSIIVFLGTLSVFWTTRVLLLNDNISIS